MKRKILFSLVLILLLNASCKKFIEVKPPVTSLSANTVFTSDATAKAAMIGIYTNMIQSSSTALSGDQSITFLTGLASDEFLNYGTLQDQIDFFENALLPGNAHVAGRWSEFYKYIYASNAIIAGLENSVGVSDPVKKQLQGEARFIRAFSYFYLVNLYGDVPIVTGIDYLVNSTVSRSPVADVYTLIINDLKEAQGLLTPAYPVAEKTRPNKFTATALLARAYLYSGDWAKAEAEATSVITSGTYTLESNLNNVFLKTSQEAIWQLEPINNSFDSYDGLYFILTSAPGAFVTVSLRNTLVTAFQPTDGRRINWVATRTGTPTYYYAFKYKIRMTTTAGLHSEYLTVFRLAEQYLIRAEARAQQNNIAGAQADINTIRSRAFGAPNPTTANDKPTLLTAIEQERRLELFAEFGHRWFDLKRWNRADAVLASIKPNWQSTDTLLPLPQQEMNRNPNLRPQNAGY
jgi:starch-binding outer membrane protein, SusD/RagB family